jgi:hypothetical protein
MEKYHLMEKYQIVMEKYRQPFNPAGAILPEGSAILPEIAILPDTGNLYQILD